jgi:hypothetical protein
MLATLQPIKGNKPIELKKIFSPFLGFTLIAGSVAVMVFRFPNDIISHANKGIQN